MACYLDVFKNTNFYTVCCVDLKNGNKQGFIIPFCQSPVFLTNQ